jgi:hypothetical protein
MANTLKFGNGQWATKVGSTLAYNDENGNFKPLPFNFTRSTSGTRVNKDGLIEVVTNNKPRIDFLNDSNGALLLEPQRTNLALYSNDLSNAAWSNSYSTITSNAAISPDGTTNANKVVETTDTGLHRAGQGAIAVTSGQVYTFSFYAKAAERNELELQRINTSGTVFNNISVTTADLILGTLSVGLNVTSSSINSVGDGWYRISLSLTAIATGSGGLNIGMQKDGNVSYLGDGTSGVYIYGFQAEQGSYATSYIPTQGASQTRSGDSTYNNNINSILGNTGTLFLEIEPYEVNTSTSVFKKILGLFKTNGSVADAIYLEEYNGDWIVLVRKGNSTITSTGYKTTQPTKVAVTFGSAGSRIYFDGVQQAFTAVDTSNAMTQISTQANAGGAIESVLKIKQLVYFPTELTISELASLTTI